MRRRAYLRTGLLWVLLVIAITLLSRPFGNLYRAPILRVGETLAQFAAPADVRVTVRMEGEKLTFAAGRGKQGLKTGIDLRLINASASLFLATVLLTPLGSAGRRALWTALGFLGFVLVMGLVVAGLALVPLVQGGFLSSGVAWRLAALAHNVSTSGLIISFPAAVWFLSTLPWWRSGFENPSKLEAQRKPVDEKLTRRERRRRKREEKNRQ